MGRSRIVSFLVVAAAISLLAPTTGLSTSSDARLPSQVEGSGVLRSANATHHDAGPKLPGSRLYRVTVRSTLASEVLGDCKKRGLDCYAGTVVSTRTYDDVRISFKRVARGYVTVASPYRARGTGTATYDHRSDFCQPERVVLAGGATFSLNGEYLPPGVTISRRGNTSPLRVEDHLIARWTGDQMKCQPRYEPVSVAARVGASLASGSLYETMASLDVQLGMLKSGPAFPVDRIVAGKSFGLTLEGTTRNTAQTKEELRSSGAVQVTDGSVRITFTPIRRATSLASARRSAGRTACALTYPGWWSKNTRGCFLIKAKARWRHVTSWTVDQYGQPCKGSDTVSMSWTSSPSTFWVGDTFPTGYTATGARSRNFFEGGVVTAKLERHVSGGARVGCVRMLSSDCGSRTATFRNVYVSGVSVDSFFAFAPTSDSALTPFRACGAVAGDGEFPVAPEWAGFTTFPVSASAPDDIGKRLRALRVGGTLTLRGAGGPPVSGPETGLPKETGSFTGELVFRRVR